MTAPKHDWEFLRETFINQNLVERDGPYTLKMLAEDHALSYSSLQNKAAKEGWMKLLDDAREVSAKKSRGAIERSRVFNELEVRVRQATYGNLAQSKAAVRLQAVQPEDLSIREAIDLLRYGAELERKALAMPDHFVYTDATPDTEGDFTLGKAQKVLDKLLGDVIEMVEAEDGSFEVTDVGDNSRSIDGETPEGSS